MFNGMPANKRREPFDESFSPYANPGETKKNLDDHTYFSMEKIKKTIVKQWRESLMVDHNLKASLSFTSDLCYNKDV